MISCLGGNTHPHCPYFIVFHPRCQYERLLISRSVDLQDLKRIMSLGDFYTISTGYKKSSSLGNYTQEYKLSIIPPVISSSRQKILEKALQQTKNVYPPLSIPSLCHSSSEWCIGLRIRKTNSRILCLNTNYLNYKKTLLPSCPSPSKNNN